MATGYCEALVQHLRVISPSYKGTSVTPNGFTNALLMQEDQPMVVGAWDNGHRREVRVKYKIPASEAQVQTSDNCGIDVIPAYSEATVPLTKYVGLSIFVKDDEIRQYCSDASDTVTKGLPPTRMMAEHLDSILHQMRPLYAKMETILTTSMSTQWGINARTGSASSTNVNFNLNGSTQNFQEGLTRLLQDFAINEMCGTPMIIGSGNIHGFAINYMSKAYGLNQNGIDQSKLADALGFEFYHSQKTASTWGSNQFGVFSKGAVHLITNPRYVDNFVMDAGIVKHFTMTDPTTSCWTPNGLSNFIWDVNMEYNNCTTTKTGGYLGSQSVNQGWNIKISANFDLFVNPAALDGADVLAGNNGTLRYTAQNA